LKKVCLDACTIINFLKPEDEEVFKTLQKFSESCKEHSELVTTDYIFEEEIKKHGSYIKRLKNLLILLPKELAEPSEFFYIYTKPKN
jgi:hypothetical protein